MSSRKGRAPASGRSRFDLRTLSLLWTLSLSAFATAAETVTLEAESDVLDLDAGTIVDSSTIAPTALAGADVRFAYNADRTPHSVVFPVAAAVELAFVAGVAFDGVSSTDIASLTFSAEATDLPFSANDCVVVHTDEGAYFKLGNVTESGISITFNYEQL